MVIDLDRGADCAVDSGLVGSGLLLISLGPSERGPDTENSEAESVVEDTSCLSLDFFLSAGFSRVS